jgi:hypothetical protein
MDVSNTPFTSRQAPSAGGTNREEPKPLLLDLDFSSTPITTTPITPAPATGGSAPSSSLLWWEQMGQEEEKPSSSSSTPMEEGSKKDGDGADEKMAVEVEQGGEGGARLGDEEDELARMQAEALRFWERKRQQEEEDMRVARLLEEELKDAPAPAPVPAPAPAPTTPAPASPNKRPYPTGTLDFNVAAWMPSRADWLIAYVCAREQTPSPGRKSAASPIRSWRGSWTRRSGSARRRTGGWPKSCGSARRKRSASARSGRIGRRPSLSCAPRPRPRATKS